MLLARIYEVFPLTCPQCRAEMRIIAFITEAVDVRAILEYIGEPATPPRIAQARGPPVWYEDATEHAIDAEACSRGRPLLPACDAVVATQYQRPEDRSSSDRAGGRFQPSCGPLAVRWRVSGYGRYEQLCITANSGQSHLPADSRPCSAAGRDGLCIS